ncbi:MAG TPA: hypothetical protein VGI74_14710 [Streptosporangiaceae bacterium]
MSTATEILDEAYTRLHHTGPEWGGNLSNHGPMAVEVLARRGCAEAVPAWVDAYIGRLDEMPAASAPVTEGNWAASLGGRVGDWAVYFNREVTERPWRELLATWWPRLLPGIAAGATHGVIRTGHAVRTLLAGDESAAALGELANGLAFWAARSTTVPGVTDPAGSLDPGPALDAVPHLAEQEGPIAGRLGRLAALPGWTGSVAAMRGASSPGQVPELLGDLVAAAARHYLGHGYASPVLLVHTATAPNAVLHTLPALPREYWLPSLTASWAASAAITAMYAPLTAKPAVELPSPPQASDPVAEVIGRACANGDEHVIKFTDAAASVYARTGDPTVLAAAIESTRLLGPQG